MGTCLFLDFEKVIFIRVWFRDGSTKVLRAGEETSNEEVEERYIPPLSLSFISQPIHIAMCVLASMSRVYKIVCVGVVSLP